MPPRASKSAKAAAAAAAAAPVAPPAPRVPLPPDEERLRRWRMILGGGEADGIGMKLTGSGGGCSLDAADAAVDASLEFVYDLNGEERRKMVRKAGRGGSAPYVARWIGDIRKQFPTSVVKVLQKDAVERLGMRELLLSPELLDTVEPDLSMVQMLMSMNGALPDESKDAARKVVRKVVDELMEKLEQPLRSAIAGSLNRATRNNRPRHNEIDWNRTIRANLRHYQAEYNSIVPERLIGWGRKARSFQRRVILCIDQSGSMAASIVYSSVFGAVMASLPAVKTHLVLFDTNIVDMTDELDDPVDILFGVQLGGGTDIDGAVGYCQGLIQDPENTIFVLISDLYEGGVADRLLKRTADMIASGLQFVVLLALSDEGRPSFDGALAAKMTALGAPSFACTPDAFPGLMAAAIQRRDLEQWAAEAGIATVRGEDEVGEEA